MLRHTSRALVTDSTRFITDDRWGPATGVIITDKDADPITLDGVRLNFLSVDKLDEFISTLAALSLDWHVRDDNYVFDAHDTEGLEA